MACTVIDALESLCAVVWSLPCDPPAFLAEVTVYTGYALSPDDGIEGKGPPWTSGGNSVNFATINDMHAQGKQCYGGVFCDMSDRNPQPQWRC